MLSHVPCYGEEQYIIVWKLSVATGFDTNL